MSAEHQYDVAGATPVHTETTSYGYDAGGLRLDQVVEDLQDPNAEPEAFNFTYDVHGSVTQLINPDTGDIAASYGYDAYGNPDGALTAGDTDTDDPLNRWRWAAERTDPLTGSQGMGARRYGPQQGRFLQADNYLGAVPNLSLSVDPLTSNRYAFAGGNPVTYVDSTGHFPTVNGHGTARFTGGTDSGTSQTDLNESTSATAVCSSSVCNTQAVGSSATDAGATTGMPGIDNPNYTSNDEYTRTLFYLADFFDYSATGLFAVAAVGSPGPTVDDLAWLPAAVIVDRAGTVANVAACLVGCLAGDTEESRSEAWQTFRNRMALEATTQVLSGAVRGGVEAADALDPRFVPAADVFGNSLKHFVSRISDALSYDPYP